ncbi:unnamed protein product [Macrosiphum euphorbiae]|uniref:LAGLIDADG homing endonuclease n=1 Tax=Macrosiphum euphorbiae TaxID=13131 RepID=A0AAV0VZP1_9HEMI|nr:unnamed protein product [Macrosiphum euphorbiae]
MLPKLVINDEGGKMLISNRPRLLPFLTLKSLAELYTLEVIYEVDGSKLSQQYSFIFPGQWVTDCLFVCRVVDKLHHISSDLPNKYPQKK